jgi:hypothetical protein
LSMSFLLMQLIFRVTGLLLNFSHKENLKLFSPLATSFLFYGQL